MKKHLFALFAIAFFCFGISASAQTTHFVKNIATGDGSGYSWDNASNDLQQMINGSAAGDQVWVAAGTYKPIYPANNLNVLTPNSRYDAFVPKKDVKIYGGFAGTETQLTQRDSTRTTNNTILSGDLGITGDSTDNSFHVVILAGNSGTGELNGFTIKDGNADGNGIGIVIKTPDPIYVTSQSGGGICYVSSNSLVTNVTVSGNSAVDGGGVSTYQSISPTFTNAIVSGNNAKGGNGGVGGQFGFGGGIFNNFSQSITYNNVIIWGNTAGYGGGFCAFTSNVPLTYMEISGNYASVQGGGVAIKNAQVSLTNLTISANRAESAGGGIYNSNTNSSAPFTNLTIKGNMADAGGGLYNNSSSPIMTNVTINGNKADNGGGIYNFGSSPIFTNVTISGNKATDGGPVYNQGNSSPKIRNSIIFGNDPFAYVDNNSPSINYSLVQGYKTGTGNINGNPDFVNLVAPVNAPDTVGNYRLSPGSIAIDKGNNAYYDAGQSPDLSAITTDLDGNPRIKNIVDLGAYEFRSHPLSVEVINFTAQADGTYSKLKWTTATESNNSAFIISRSADGKIFTELEKVAGAGNSTTQNDYVYYDENPLNGINFYRLEQMDYDGHKTDLGIRTVNFASVVNNFIKVYPNPVKNFVRIEFATNTYQQLELTDENGKVFQQIPLNTLDSEKKMDMSNLPSGVYFIKLTGNDKVESKKVVKE